MNQFSKNVLTIAAGVIVAQVAVTVLQFVLFLFVR